MIETIIASCPTTIDLKSDAQAEQIIQTVESILKEANSLSELKMLEKELISRNDTTLIFSLLALKIAKSKILATKVSEPLLISIIFAVYKEHNRIKTAEEHIHGEDFLVKKVRQLEWLFYNLPYFKWELIVVDDGCPNGSGAIAQQIIDLYRLNAKVRVLYLAQAIEKNYPPAQNLSSTSDSQKGGAIIYGVWDAVQRPKTHKQIVVYTDADLSTHLGQLMLLVDPLLKGANLAAIGSRREPESVLLKAARRNQRGKLFIYLWKRLIPNLSAIIDTQCGFKAFKAEIIPHLIDNLLEKKFAFDIELLLKTELLQKSSVVKVPIAWIDSAEASTTTALQPYLPMLKSIVKMSQKYFQELQKENEFIHFITTLNETEFSKLLENIPAAIAKREPEEFTDYAEVAVTDLNKALKN